MHCVSVLDVELVKSIWRPEGGVSWYVVVYQPLHHGEIDWRWRGRDR